MDAAHLHLLAEGAHRYDAGAYWHAHESWERAWLATAAPQRHALQALIQLAAIAHHLDRGRPRAARQLCTTARARLAHAGDCPFPLPIAVIATAIADVAAALDAGAHPHPPRLHLVGRLARHA